MSVITTILEHPTRLQIFGDYIVMDSSTKDKAKGSLDEAKGKVKEKAGQVTNNRDLEQRGAAEKMGGKVKKKIGDVKKVFNK